MGADFIRSTAAPHTKQWSAEYQHASDDLFAQDCVSAGHSYIVTPDGHSDVQEHEVLHVRLLGERACIYRGLTKIGEIERSTVFRVKASGRHASQAIFHSPS